SFMQWSDDTTLQSCGLCLLQALECCRLTAGKILKAVTRAAKPILKGSARCGRFRGTDVMEYWIGTPRQSGLMLAARITFAHLAVSDSMTTANSSGELRDASRPSCAILSRTSACMAICTMSVCTLLTTAAGVSAGANSPNQ